MASPQAENGYTPIANEIIEALYKREFKGSHLRIILWLFRSTWGWRKKILELPTYRKMGDELNMSIGTIHLALEVLIQAGVIFREENGKLRFNKDYESWGVQPSEHGILFSPANKSVQPSEHGVQPSEHGVQPSEHLIRCKTITDKTITDKTRKSMAHRNEIPTLQEAMDFFKEHGPQSDPEHFFDHHEARGWIMSNGRKVKNWQAAARTWIRNQDRFSKPIKKIIGLNKDETLENKYEGIEKWGKNQ